MKKFFLLIAAVSISFGAMSQKGKVTSALSYIDQGMLDKAKEAIDQALVNEKTMNWSNTYFAKGKLCQAVLNLTIQNSRNFILILLQKHMLHMRKQWNLIQKVQ